MPACTVCAHPSRDAIDRRLVAGEYATNLGPEYGLSWDAVNRHRHTHLPQLLVQARQAAVVAGADNLLEFLEELKTAAVGILNEAQAGFEKVLGHTPAGDVVTAHVRDHALALEAIRRLEGLVTLLARVQGQLPSGGTTNVFLSPDFSQFIARLMTALAPFPEARIAAAAALSGLEMPALAEAHTDVIEVSA